MRSHHELAQAFDAFHASNPQVYLNLRALALEARAAGVVRGNIALLTERLRASAVATTGGPYKVDNSFRAFYARLLMANEPALQGFFQIRAERHDPQYHSRVEPAPRPFHRPSRRPAALERETTGSLF